MNKIDCDIVECINGTYYELTLSERRISDYVRAQYDNAQEDILYQEICRIEPVASQHSLN